MSSTTVRRRVARRPRSCASGHPIPAGAAYLLWTEFPGGEAGYADAAGHPVQMSECADCATRYGRQEMLQ